MAGHIGAVWCRSIENPGTYWRHFDTFHPVWSELCEIMEDHTWRLKPEVETWLKENMASPLWDNPIQYCRSCIFLHAPNVESIMLAKLTWGL